MERECVCDHGEPQEWYCTAKATRRHCCNGRWIALCEECNDYCHNRENEKHAAPADAPGASTDSPASAAPRHRA